MVLVLISQMLSQVQLNPHVWKECWNLKNKLLEFCVIILEKCDDETINELYNDTDLKDWKLYNIIIENSFESLLENYKNVKFTDQLWLGGSEKCDGKITDLSSLHYIVKKKPQFVKDMTYYAKGVLFQNFNFDKQNRNYTFMYSNWRNNINYVL